MILTHPYLFNTIVILFIAFTSGWMVYVMVSRRASNLKDKMEALEIEKEILRLHAKELEEQFLEPSNNTPVISLSASVKQGKTQDGSI